MRSAAFWAGYYGLRADASDDFVQGYLDAFREDRKGQGKPCGRGFISARKKCSQKGRQQLAADLKAGDEGAKKRVARGKELGAARSRLNREIKSAKGQNPRVKEDPAESKSNAKMQGEGLPTLDQAEKTLKKIGEGAEGVVFVSTDGKSVFKYARKSSALNQSEFSIMSKAGDLGISPKVLAINNDSVQVEYLSDHSDFASLKDGLLTKEQERQIVGGMVQSLERLHNAGIAHGDFHDRNVLVNPSKGDVKIIDFGKSSDLTLDNAWRDVSFMADWYQSAYLFSLPIMRDTSVRAEMNALKIEWGDDGNPKIPDTMPSLTKLIDAINNYS